jgi:hypothetical protein
MTPIRYQNYAFLHFCYCKHAKSTVIISFLAVLILQTYKKHSNYMLFCTFDIKLQLLRAPGDLNPIGVAFAMALNSCGDSKHIGPQFMRGLLAQRKPTAAQRKHNGNTTETQRKHNGNTTEHNGNTTETQRKHNGTQRKHNGNTTETQRNIRETQRKHTGITPGPRGFPQGPRDSPGDSPWPCDLQCALALGIPPGPRGFPWGFLPGIAPGIPPGIGLGPANCNAPWPRGFWPGPRGFHQGPGDFPRDFSRGLPRGFPRGLPNPVWETPVCPNGPL